MSKLAKFIARNNQDTTTCKVVFGNSPVAQHYTYRCVRSDNLKQGDLVNAETKGVFKVVMVVSVDDTAQIDINASYEYGFIYGKIDDSKVNAVKHIEATQLKLRKEKS